MIEIKNLYLTFTKEFDALHNINLQIANGEKVALVGKADSGKTMLLRTLAKLENYKSGEIYIKNINLKNVDFKRDVSVGFVPKSFVFLKGKTVRENLVYMLSMRNMDSATINLKVLTALKTFNIESLQNLKINELSNYQKTLVQLARVSMRRIELFLIDDICSGLTNSETQNILNMFKTLLSDNPESTFIFAFSSMELATALNLKIVNLKDGFIISDEQKD